MKNQEKLAWAVSVIKAVEADDVPRARRIVAEKLDPENMEHLDLYERLLGNDPEDITTALTELVGIIRETKK